MPAIDPFAKYYNVPKNQLCELPEYNGPKKKEIDIARRRFQLRKAQKKRKNKLNGQLTAALAAVAAGQDRIAILETENAKLKQEIARLLGTN